MKREINKILKEIEMELIKDKKFRNELSVAVIKDFLDSNKMDISEKDVDEKMKQMLKILVNMKLESIEYEEELQDN